ncbi:hypothetical protein Hanom_Chr07g00672891 [Helianthus anomalus]
MNTSAYLVVPVTLTSPISVHINSLHDPHHVCFLDILRIIVGTGALIYPPVK